MCGEQMNVQGGMVGTVWMGPEDSIPCPNKECDAIWSDNFTNMGSAVLVSPVAPANE